MNDRILDLVKERMAKGRAQYGHGLLEKSGYDWVQEALEEALDLSIYVAARLIEIKAATPNTQVPVQSASQVTPFAGLDG
jgi:hypothetical protein